MCKSSLHAKYLCLNLQMSYQVRVEVEGVEREGEEEGRLENRVHRGSWVGELG